MEDAENWIQHLFPLTRDGWGDPKNLSHDGIPGLAYPETTLKGAWPNVLKGTDLVSTAMFTDSYICIHIHNIVIYIYTRNYIHKKGVYIYICTYKYVYIYIYNDIYIHVCVSLITVRKTTKRAPLVSPISVWLPGFFFSNLCSSWQGHLQTYGFQHVTLGMEQWVGDCEDFAEILKLDEFEVAPSDLTKAGINLFKQLKVGRNREASKTSLSFNVHVRTTWRHVLRMQSCNIYIYIYIL